MGNPIQSIRTTYDYAKKARDNGRPLSNEEIVKMLNTIGVPEELIENYPRFQKGYAAEDLFMRIYSLLPWIKNIVPLGQEQFPEKSKETSQVSDYLVTYEIGDKNTTSTLLVEVKLVDEKKQTHEIRKCQYEVLEKYSIDNHLTLLFALFWKSKGIWTLNSIDVFDEKSSAYKVSMIKAIQNDLSSIFGDFTYIFYKPFYLMTRYSNDSEIKTQYLSTHEKYGRTALQKISSDNITYTEIDGLLSPVIDCLFNLPIISENSIDSTETELVEQYVPNQNNIVFSKITSLMYSYLVKLWYIDHEDLYFKDNDLITDSFGIVNTAGASIWGEVYYQLPVDSNSIHNTLMISQFQKVSHIINLYMSDESRGNAVLYAPHEANNPPVYINIKLGD